MNSSYLRYGDYITINSPFYDKNSKKNIGYLSAKGFFDKKVYFQTHDPEQDTSIITNYRDLVFQVWPLLSFESYKQMHKIEAQKQIIKQKFANAQKNDPKLHDATMQIETDYQKCLERIKGEKEYNQKTFDLSFGYDVTYGTDIVLMHLDSRMFLNSRIVTSEADKSAFKFELSEDLSSGVVFRFIPKFKLRQYGENIQFSDPLLILSVKLNCYINFSLDTPMPFDKELAKEPNAKPFIPYYKSIRTKRLDPLSLRYEAYLSQFSDLQWTLSSHGREARLPGERKIIKGGELIRLRNTETGGDLTATLNFQLDNSELYLRNYVGEYSLEKDTVNSLFEIELIESEACRGNDCIFIDEKATQPITFRLRHFITGYLLGYQEDKGEKIPVLMNRSSYKEKNSSIFEIRFVPTITKEINALKNYGVYQIEFQGGFFLCIDEKRQFLREKYIKTDEKEDVFTPLTDNEMGIQRKALCLKHEKSEENAFQIIRVSEEERMLILQISSAVPVLTYLRDIFKYQIKDENFGELCKKAFEILKNLIFFMIKTESSDPFECEGIPIPENQKVFKDMKLIEVLVDILYFPFRHNIYNLNNLVAIPEELIKIFILSYRLIKFSIKEYRPNELYSSQWLGLFMVQTLLADQRVDIMAEPTLTELIDNNRIVLETKISKENIKNFVDLIVKSPLKKFVKLLRAVCVCDGQPMILNQTEISRFVFEDQQARSIIVFPLRELPGKKGIEILVKGQWKNLLDFQMNKESEEYEFFVSMTELNADLCLNKNFIAVQFLKEIYTFPICFLILSNPVYSEEIRVAFSKLIITLWIEVEGDYIQPLSSIRTWEEISANQEIKLRCLDKNVQLFDPLKGFINDHLAKIAKDEYMKGYDKDKNLMTLEFLHLLKSMTLCGFLKTMEEINSFLPNLLAILKSVHDVTDADEDQVMAARLSKQKSKKDLFSLRKKTKKNVGKIENKRFVTRYNETEETAIMMQCKETICDILKFFFDLRTDMRITAFMQEFRKEYEHLAQMSENNQQMLASNINNNEESQTLSSLLKNSSKRFLKKIGIEEEGLKKNNYDVFQYIDNPLQWVQSITQKKSIAIVESSPVDLVALLLDLTLYENPDLVNKAFELLYLLHSQSQGVLEAVSEVQLLENESLVKIFKEIKEINEKLKDLVDGSEIWYELKGEMSLEKYNETKASICKLIELLDIREINQNNEKNPMMMEPEDEQHAPTKSKQLLLEEEEEKKHNENSRNDQQNQTSLLLEYTVGKDRQELMRNLNVAANIITLIKFDLDVSEKDNNSNLQLMKLCYKFLAGFCRANNKNQALLEENFEFFLSHLKKSPESDAHLLIMEVAANNKRILLDSWKIHEIFTCFCDIIEKSSNPLVREYMMNSLQNFLKYRNSSIKLNQTRLISTMGSNSYQNILHLFREEKDFTEFFNKVQRFQQIVEEKINNKNIITLDLPNEIVYFSQQMYILSLVSDEKNYAAESRCQNFFPLEQLKKLLENTKNMWYIRKYLLFFLFNVYFETEQEMNENLNLLNQIILLIVDDFEILSSTLDENLTTIEIKTFKGKTSLYTIELDYLNGGLLPCLNLIFKLNLISSGVIMDIYKRCLEAITKLAPKILSQKQSIYSLAQFLKIMMKKKTIMKALNFEENYRSLLPSILFADKKGGNLFKASITQRGFNQNANNFAENVSKSEKFRKRIEQTMKSTKTLNLFEQEFEVLVENIVTIEANTEKTFANLCTIGYKELCVSLLKLIDPTDMTLSMSLTIVGLKVFRKIIEGENTDLQTCAADWSTEDFAAFSKKIQSRQNQLCDFGLVEVIGNMIGNVTLSRELKNEAILVGIAMLLGGNAKVQDRLFKYLSVDDSKNLFLVNIKEMIEDDFLKIKKNMEARNRAYQEKIMEFEAEYNENRQKTMIMEPNIQDPGSKTDKRKGASEEEQALIEKEREEEGKKAFINSKKDLDTEIDEEEDSEQDEIKEKIQNSTRIFRLLQLFCEGHKQDMQNHLRVQIMHKVIHGKTQNFISNSSYKFGSLVKFVNVHCTSLLTQIMDFLIEAIQGPCRENQAELSKAKIVEFVKDLLASFIQPKDYLFRGFASPEEQEIINNIITKSSNLLISLIEGNTNDEILKDLSLRLDFGFMRQVLVKEFESFVGTKLGLTSPYPSCEEINEMINFQNYEGNIASAFNVFLLIKTIATNLINPEDLENKNPAQYALERESDEVPGSQTLNLAIDFFNSNCVSIEILFQEKLHRIFFPIQPVCRNLSKGTRMKLMAEVKRDSPNEKIMGLLGASSDLFNEMQHMTHLKTWRLSFTAKRLSFFRDLSTLIAFFLNILMMATFYRKIQTDSDQTDFAEVYSVIMEGGAENTDDGRDINILLWVFGAIQLATSGLMLLYWIVLYSDLVIKKKWREFINENKQKMVDNNIEQDLEERDVFDIETVDGKYAQYLLYVKGPESKYFIKDGKKNFGTRFLAMHYYIKSTVMLFSEPSLLYSIFYIAVSLLGLLLSPLFYCYHLLDIVSRFETLKNVIRSVTRNANQLLLTLFLGLLILYMFTILMFFFLFDTYFNSGIKLDHPTGQNMCSTMFQCYLTTVNMGLRNGGGFGDITTNESYTWDNRGRYFLSFIIKISSFSLINIIFLNIIFGIIIDTFAELRDEKSRIDEDMKNICFICGLDRYDFEKSGDGFDAHIDRDHRLWNYIYYIYYLKTKDETEYSGIESEIAAKIEQDDNSWFPIMKAMVLGEGEKKVIVGDIINEKAACLKEKLDEVGATFDQKVKGLKKK